MIIQPSRHVSVVGAVPHSCDDSGLPVLELSGGQQEVVVISEDRQLRHPPEQSHPQGPQGGEDWGAAECLQ